MATSHSDVRIGPRRKHSSRIKPAHDKRPRVVQIGSKPKHWATEQDIKFLVRKLDILEDIEKRAGYFGFRLSKSKLEILRKKLQAKAKREDRRKEKEKEIERKLLEDALQSAINEIVPVCRGYNCENRFIQPKKSSQYHAPSGPTLRGPGGPRGYTTHSIDFLYCPSCGLVYYNEEVKELSTRYSRGEFQPKTLVSRGSPFPDFR